MAEVGNQALREACEVAVSAAALLCRSSVADVAQKPGGTQNYSQYTS